MHISLLRKKHYSAKKNWCAIHQNSVFALESHAPMLVLSHMIEMLLESNELHSPFDPIRV